MRFQLLGNFEVLIDNTLQTPSAPKLRQALALLVLRNNEVVPTKVLIDELWGSRPPSKAVRTIHTYIYELRRSMARANGNGYDQILQTRPNGYTIQVPESSIDLHSFRALVREGREELAVGDPGRARSLLTRALGLWQGSALANVDRGELLEAHVTELEESRLRALEMRVEADFQLCRHHDLIGELKALATARPLHEGIHAKLMLALYRSGRRSEGLEVFQDLRRRLIEELGLEPEPELQRLQRSMLTADPCLDPPCAAPMARPHPDPVPLPAHLPRDTVHFTGRRAVLEEIGGYLAAGGGRTGMPVVSLVGMPGVGKTATAVHLAHTIRKHYPDGQLYVPLEGSRPAPATAFEGLGQLLRGIGLPPEEIPGTLGGRMARFRTWSFDRRVLVVLDDADSAEQLHPLLPGGTGCAVVITSRSLLYRLGGAQTVYLRSFPVHEGVELLARVAGPERIGAEPEAAAEIVRLTDGLPLALDFIAERLKTPPRMPLAEVVKKIRAAKQWRRHRMSKLAVLGLDLYDRFEDSFRRLDKDAQAALLEMAVLPGRLFTVAQGARALGIEPPTAEVLLTQLVDASLLEVVSEDDLGQRYYRLHELVYEYALERLGTPGTLMQPPPVLHATVREPSTGC